MTRPKAKEPVPQKRLAKKAETHKRVLAAAMQLFAKNGFEGTSTAQIAEEAGVAHGTIFAVAPTKESLLVAAYADEIRAVGEKIGATLPLKRPLAAQLEHIFDGLFDYYTVNPALSRAILQHLLFIPDTDTRSQHDRLLTDLFDALRCLMDGAKERGDIRADVNSDDLATVCFSTYMYFLLALLNDSYASRAHHRRDFRRVLELSLRSATQ